MNNEEPGFDLDRFITQFNSNENTVLTNEIYNFVDRIMEWIRAGSTGAIAYGRPRIGKTRAINYLMHSLKVKYGNDFPVFIWDGNYVRIGKNAKYFYQCALESVGGYYLKTDTLVALKKRLINLIITLGQQNNNKFVVIVDEAQHMTYADFTAMIELYNLVVCNGVYMITILVGDLRLKNVKTELSEMGYEQIIGRFMIHEITFHGVTSVNILTVILKNLDEHFDSQDENGKGVLISRDLFPKAYASGWSLKDTAEDLWRYFIEICDPEKLGMDEIPMEYLVQALTYIILHYSAPAETPVDFITPAIIKEAIRSTDYKYTKPVVITGRRKRK